MVIDYTTITPTIVVYVNAFNTKYMFLLCMYLWYKGSMETIETREPRKRGPKPRLGEMHRTNVMVEPDLLDWGKDQPGGFSELVRRLVREEKSRQEQTGSQVSV